MSSDAVETTPDRSPVMQGVVVMTVFGLGWALLAVSGLDLPVGALVALVVLAAAAAATSVVAAKRSLDRLPAHAGSGRTVLPDAGKRFHLVNAAQTTAIVVAVFALVRAEEAPFIPAVVCAVVGAHFLPLARIFGLPLYRWTGALLVLTAGAGALALVLGVGAGPARTAVGLPAALVLWGTATVLARRG